MYTQEARPNLFPSTRAISATQCNAEAQYEHACVRVWDGAFIVSNVFACMVASKWSGVIVAHEDFAQCQRCPRLRTWLVVETTEQQQWYAPCCSAKYSCNWVCEAVKVMLVLIALFRTVVDRRNGYLILLGKVRHRIS
jgi:hypothetical protein